MKPKIPKHTWKKDFSDEEDHTLLYSVIIVRTLFGGPIRMIDWPLIQTVLLNHKIENLMDRWRWLRDVYTRNLRKLQFDFQNYFLRDFERGILPYYNPNNPKTFSLVDHVLWFKNTVPVMGYAFLLIGIGDLKTDYGVDTKSKLTFRKIGESLTRLIPVEQLRQLGDGICSIPFYLFKVVKHEWP